jgi:hypothetical protein
MLQDQPVDHGLAGPDKAAAAIDISTVQLPAEISKQFYAHGGFMGAAPQLLADPHWRKILFARMPDVAGEFKRTIEAGEEGIGKRIVMMENNPPMSAFGMWQTRALDKAAAARGESAERVATIQAFEWDVFVPDDTVTRYERMSSSLIGRSCDTWCTRRARACRLA